MTLDYFEPFTERSSKTVIFIKHKENYFVWSDDALAELARILTRFFHFDVCWRFILWLFIKGMGVLIRDST